MATVEDPWLPTRERGDSPHRSSCCCCCRHRRRYHFHCGCSKHFQTTTTRTKKNGVVVKRRVKDIGSWQREKEEDKNEMKR